VRSTDDLDKLMGGERARMAFVDAPYNLSIEKQVQSRGKIRHKEFAFASGEMGDSEFTEFLRQSFANKRDVDTQLQ
jgi:hypothetical protein